MFEELGFITEHVDVGQITFVVFMIFFVGLVLYLQAESRREGYPLEYDVGGKLDNPGLFMPGPKTFELPHGHGSVTVPNDRRDANEMELKAERIAVWDGAPYEPTGENPMLDCIGPGAYCLRADVPDVTMHNEPKIVPLSSPAAHEFELNGNTPNPIGMKVVGCNRGIAGTITDVWVDKAESIIRFYEMEVAGVEGATNVLIPFGFATVDGRMREVYVHALQSTQFAEVPKTRNSDTITMLEEEKIMGYFGAGLLYATERRMEPAI